MDTVNRVVNAASTALWGEGGSQTKDVPHGEEPISGVQGKGVANDPYDAGNRDEQPEAPLSDGNTAPQEPKLDGTPLNADTESTAAAGGSGSSEAPALTPKPTAAQPEQRSTEEAPEKPKETKETESQDFDSPKPSSNNSHSQVSTEALKGPQGPAPKPAEEFEKEMKGQKKPKEKETPKEKEVAKEKEPAAETGASPTSSKHSNDQTSAFSANSDKSAEGGHEKHGTMAKIKERLNKVAHPRHHDGNKA